MGWFDWWGPATAPVMPGQQAPAGQAQVIQPPSIQTAAGIPGLEGGTPLIDSQVPNSPSFFQSQAAKQADLTGQRQTDVYNQAQAQANPYATSVNGKLYADVPAGYQEASRNQTYTGATGAAGDAMQAQNGGGAMGGYGGAAAGAIMAGAGVQDRANQAALSAHYLDAGTAWQNEHTSQLAGINQGNPAFGQQNALYGGAQSQADWQKQFDTNQSNLQNANYGQAVSGTLGAAGNLLGNPAITGLIGAGVGGFFGGPPGAAAGYSLGSAAPGAAKSFFGGGGGQPAPQPAPGLPGPTYGSPAYGSFRRNASGGNS